MNRAWRVVAPSRGRGLKPDTGLAFTPVLRRPFTGAWIETCVTRKGRRRCQVAPSRGRGLKRSRLSFADRRGVAPSRGRGLKRGNTPSLVPIL